MDKLFLPVVPVIVLLVTEVEVYDTYYKYQVASSTYCILSLDHFMADEISLDHFMADDERILLMKTPILYEYKYLYLVQVRYSLARVYCTRSLADPLLVLVQVLLLRPWYA